MNSDPMHSAHHRSGPFKKTREDHLVEAAEDYTELIAELEVHYGEARICRVAEYLGVSHVTALRTVKRLQEEGYLDTSPHRPITLTAKGKKLAALARERHTLLVNFLFKLGVPLLQAEIDAEGIEHHVSKKTLQCIKKFLRTVVE